MRPDGHTTTYHADGTRTETSGDTTTELRADGTRLRETRAGSGVTDYDLDGVAARTEYEDGTVSTWTRRQAGTSEEVLAETFADGRENLFRPDGTLLRRREASGAMTLFDAQGRITIEVDAEGWVSTSRLQPDGSRRLLRGDGQVRELRADGSLFRITEADGTVEVRPQDGVLDRVTTCPNGFEG